MGAKRSDEMKKALLLISQGKSKYEAARIAGVTRPGIYAALAKDRDDEIYRKRKMK